MSRPGWLLLSLMLVAGCGPRPEAPAAGPDFPVGRLPDTVRPLSYQLALTILPDRTDFAGTTTIEVEIGVPTSVIFLHGNGLDVTGATLTTPAGASFPASYEQLDDTGVARLRFASPVPAGPASLSLSYSAPFRTRSEGLYRSTVDGESYAFTQFQPIDARRMFPGFDEPAFKTPFTVEVTTRTGNVVIGNTPVVREEFLDDGLKRVLLAPTEPLPTYLLALAVGPLDVVEGKPLAPNRVRQRPVPLAAAATRGKGPRLRFALDNTAAMVDYLEDYFGVEYPYPKLDLIASPEFGSGGMENAGAIVYGDSRILLAADMASVEQQRGFGAIHAHELAHQWFGNLVTPRWWDDIWLNESFASWMGYKAAKAWRPEYPFDIIPMAEAIAAMELDSRVAARQIRQPVDRNLDIVSAFDGITYLKGSGVLSMFENYLGEEAFREGIRTHMRRFTHGVADVEDFMVSLAEGSGRPDVVPAFRSFIDQAGLPLVSVALDCGGDQPSLRLGQSRYLPVGSRGDPARTWQIPFCFTWEAGGVPGRQCVLLTEAETSVALDVPACPAFVMPNADGAGYYRFALDPDAWKALLDNLGRLSQREALAVADSVSAAFQASRLSTAELVAALRIIAASPYAQVAMAPGKDLVRLRDWVVPPEARPAVTALMGELYRPRLAGLGPAGRGSDAAAVEQALFRTNLIRLLALEARDPALRAELTAQARRFVRLDGPGEGLDESAVPPALTEIALSVAVQELGAPFAEVLIQRLLASSDVQFRTQAAAALGATDDPALGDRVRALLLDPGLRGREPSTLAFALAARPSQSRATFDWYRANQAAFTAQLSSFAHRWLPRLGAGFCTLPERDEVEAFFTPLLPGLQGADRTLAETLESIELCAALAAARREEAGRFFTGG